MSNVTVTPGSKAGSVELSGPFGSFAVEVDECDVCDEPYFPAERWVVWQRRPSTGEWTEVMWVCPTCGPGLGATPIAEGEPSDE